MPKQSSQPNLSPILLQPDWLYYISREAGVRNLKKHLEKIYRKVAIKMVKRADQAPKPRPDLPASTSSVGEPEVAEIDHVTPNPTPEGYSPCSSGHIDPTCAF